MLRLPERVRSRLKRPLGQLFPDVAAAVERLRQLNPSRLISVGDIVSAGLLKAGLRPDVVIIDMRTMRSPIDEKTKQVIENLEVEVVRVKNPAGTITRGLREALEKAKPPLKIVVEGEEDLAVLPAVLAAPLGSIVAYGQPREGTVLVEVTEQKKHEFKNLLKSFKTSE